MFCSLKHFPGIGKSKVDPHLDGYSITASKKVLEEEDLRPFRELLRQVDHDKVFVMVSNVSFAALDEKYPACLSSAIMTDLLRNQYGYKGLIVTDDMEMGAMTKYYTFRRMGVMSVKAGADIVLSCHDYGNSVELYNGMLEALRSGELPAEMVDEKVGRIVKTKLLQMN